MAGSGDHLNAVASQPAGSSPTREEFANLQQFNQLCAKLERAGIFGAPNSTIGGQTRLLSFPWVTGHPPGVSGLIPIF